MHAKGGRIWGILWNMRRVQHNHLPEDGGVAQQKCGGCSQHGVGEKGWISHHEAARTRHQQGIGEGAGAVHEVTCNKKKKYK